MFLNHTKLFEPILTAQKPRLALTAAFCGLLALLPACAATPDPAVVCTSQWIKPRADSAINEMTRESSSLMKKLSKAANTYAKGGTMSPLQILSVSSSISRLANTISNGQGTRDLKTLARTCKDPQILTQAMSGFIHNQDLPEPMVDFIETLPQYQKMVEEMVREIETDTVSTPGS